jgi:hypothetical protein
VTPLYPQMAVTSPTSGGSSVGIVRSPTQATELVIFIMWFAYKCQISQPPNTVDGQVVAERRVFMLLIVELVRFLLPTD